VDSAIGKTLNKLKQFVGYNTAINTLPSPHPPRLLHRHPREQARPRNHIPTRHRRRRHPPARVRPVVNVFKHLLRH